MKRSILIVLAIFSIAFASDAFAATYYVDASCESSGDGTTAVCGTHGPWKTLSEAASGVATGANHTISVAAGTYPGFTDSRSGPGSTPEVDSSYRIWKANGTVTITSQVTINGDWVKVDGFTISNMANGLAMGDPSSADHCWLTNLTVSVISNAGATINGTNHLITNWDMSQCADYWHVFGSGHTFRGNYVHNHTSQGTFHSDVWQTYHGGEGVAQDITIEQNHIFLGIDATGTLTSQTSGSLHVFMIDDTSGGRHPSNWVIRNNIFEALGWYNSDQAHPDELRIYNNLFRADDDQDNKGSGPVIVGWSVGSPDDIKIRNNMFIDKTQGVSIESGATNVSCSNNLFWRYDGGSMTNQNYSGSDDITGTDPLFATYDKVPYNLTDDYKLQSSSPAKDTGYDLTGTVTDDYYGNSRPQGSGYDIGAYEFYESENEPPLPPTGLRLISSN